MFGVVPRVLWERVYPPDEKNRITLRTNLLLAETPQARILVDTGIGSKISDRFREIYAVERPGMPDGFPVPTEEIEVVLLTHLHFDHCGGSTVRRDGHLQPTFPRATYYVQKQEWEDALHPNERSRASYLPENFVPLQEAGVLRLLEGDQEVLPGVRVLVTPGHTRAHQIVVFETSEGIVAFAGDFLPTSRHAPLPWIMAYDLYPVQTLETRKRLYPRIIEEQWLLVLEHDDRTYLGHLRADRDRVLFEPANP